jgi:hypothetical protein
MTNHRLLRRGIRSSFRHNNLLLQTWDEVVSYHLTCTKPQFLGKLPSYQDSKRMNINSPALDHQLKSLAPIVQDGIQRVSSRILEAVFPEVHLESEACLQLEGRWILVDTNIPNPALHPMRLKSNRNADQVSLVT